MKPGRTLGENLIDLLTGNQAKSSASQESELKQLALRLQEAANLAQLTGLLVHDINNLVTVIGNYLQMVSYKIGKDSEAHKLLEEAISAALIISQICNETLMLSRNEGIAKEEINIELLINALIRKLKTAFGHILIEIEIKKPIDNITGNPTQLTHVLLNLFLNARDALEEITERNKTISINAEMTTERSQPHVKLTFQDNGAGMGFETRKLIFERNFSKKNTDERIRGIGLFACETIIREQFNGWIEVSSKPNKGTKFEIYIPC